MAEDDTSKTSRRSSSSDTSSTSGESTSSRSSADTTQQSSSRAQTRQTRQSSEPAGPDSSQVVFTAQSADTRDAFADSDQVRSGDWNPETHGQPPDARPSSDF